MDRDTREYIAIKALLGEGSADAWRDGSLKQFRDRLARALIKRGMDGDQARAVAMNQLRKLCSTGRI